MPRCEELLHLPRISNFHAHWRERKAVVGVHASDSTAWALRKSFKRITEKRWKTLSSDYNGTHRYCYGFMVTAVRQIGEHSGAYLTIELTRPAASRISDRVS